VVSHARRALAAQPADPNRGDGGNTVAGPMARWQSETLALKPDLLGIPIGIDDLGCVTAADFEREYDGLLADTAKALSVRCQKAFDAACERAPADYWIWDGIHPARPGRQVLAAE
jgi:hypothetical protein